MPLVKTGVVSGVDPVNFIVSVNLFDGSAAIDIQYASTYFSSPTGGGVVCIPEVNSVCLLTEVDGEYIIIGFISDKDQRYKVTNDIVKESDDKLPGFRCGRPAKWSPGDIGLVSANNNGAYVKVGSDGILSLFSSPLCSMHFLPAPKNAIEITSDNVSWTMGEGLFYVDTDRKKDSSELYFQIVNPSKTEAIVVEASAKKDGSTVSINLSNKASMEYTKDGGLTASFEGPVSTSSEKNISFNDGNLVIKK